MCIIYAINQTTAQHNPMTRRWVGDTNTVEVMGGTCEKSRWADWKVSICF